MTDSNPATYAIDSFAPEPYEVLRPIVADIAAIGEGDFAARLAAANLTGYGDTPDEAVKNLKLVILDTFDRFTSGKRLGPGQLEQWAALRELVRKTADAKVTP